MKRSTASREPDGSNREANTLWGMNINMNMSDMKEYRIDIRHKVDSNPDIITYNVKKNFKKSQTCIYEVCQER